MNLKNKDIKIVFMGTPDFAGYSLEKLIENKYNVQAVVTVADKKAGRGRKIRKSPVKEIAEKAGIPVLQPTNLKSEEFLKELKEINADLFIVVAFRMLPKVVWQMPEIGTFNLHASLLPDYRGAAPINHAIINGETKTGVTTFFIDEKIDTGKIIFSKEVEILPQDTAGTLHDKLMTEGAELIKKTVNAILENSVKTISQETLISQEKNVNSAPKIFKDDCLINWDNKPEKIYNFVRGLSPYPVAITVFTDKTSGKKMNFKIYEVEIIKEEHNLKSGRIISDNKSEIKISCKEGFIKINSLQAQGKKQMSVKDFLNGFDISKFEIADR